jgi:hypothetical protein
MNIRRRKNKKEKDILGYNKKIKMSKGEKEG